MTTAAPTPWSLIRRRWAQAIRDARELHKYPGSLVVISSRGHDSSSGRGSPSWGRHGSVAWALGALSRRDEEGARLAALVQRQLDEGGLSLRLMGRRIGRSHESVWRDLNAAWSWMCDPEHGRILTREAWQRGIEEEPDA